MTGISNRRSFLSSAARLAVAASAGSALATCAVVPVLAADTRMQDLIEAHREALASYERECAKAEAIHDGLPKRARVPLSKDGLIGVDNEDMIYKIGEGDQVWIDTTIAKLQAARVAYQKAWDNSGLLEQEEVASAAVKAESDAFDALMEYRPRTMDDVRHKASYLASCRPLTEFTEWNGVGIAEWLASLVPAAA